MNLSPPLFPTEVRLAGKKTNKQKITGKFQKNDFKYESLVRPNLRARTALIFVFLCHKKHMY